MVLDVDESGRRSGFSFARARFGYVTVPRGFQSQLRHGLTGRMKGQSSLPRDDYGTPLRCYTLHAFV